MPYVFYTLLAFRHLSFYRPNHGACQFFPNDDEPLKRGYNFDNVLMTFSVPLEKSFGREVFDYEETSATFRFYRPYF